MQDQGYRRRGLLGADLKPLICRLLALVGARYCLRYRFAGSIAGFPAPIKFEIMQKFPVIGTMQSQKRTP